MAGKLYIGMDPGKSFRQVSMVDERNEAVRAPPRVRRGSEQIEKLPRQMLLDMGGTGE